MTTFLYLAMSLDGFIAGPDGDLGWLEQIPNPENSDFGFAAFMGSIDAVVMGRKTFEKVLSFDSWPYQKPVFILSHTLEQVPSDLIGRVHLARGTPRTIIQSLSQKGFNRIYVDGGETIRGFLAEDLIDEMIIATVPILLGDGIPLFGKDTGRLEFLLQKLELINQHLFKSHYRRCRNGGPVPPVTESHRL